MANFGSSTLTSCLISPLLWLVLLVLHQHPTWIPRARTRLCLSPFTVLHLTLQEWELVSNNSHHFQSVNLTFYVANPVATFWTACEMLAWIGEQKAADQLLEIVESVCEAGIMTKDLGGSATTVEVTDAVCRAIEKKLVKQV